MPTSRNDAGATSTCFRAPGAGLPLEQLLQRAWPDATQAECEALVQRGAVRVAGRPLRKPGARVAPGRLVEVSGRSQQSVPASAALAAPVWRVLVPALPWRRGLLAKRRDAPAIRFERRDERGGVADLQVQADAAGAPAAPLTALAEGDVRRAFALAGHPILADAVHAGILVDGGLRLWPCDEEGGDPDTPGWWPDEPVFPGDEKGAPRPVLGVSAATTRILRRGHPWVLLDDETDDPAPFAPGTRVDVRSPDGESLGVACIEGTGRLTARMFRGVSKESDAGVEARVAAALRRRHALVEPAADAPATDAYRLIHGEADGLPGLFVDRLGPALRVLVTSAGTRSYRDRALDALVRHLEPQLGSDPPVVEVLHLRDRPAGELECTRLARGAREALPAGSARLVVRERGVAFRVDLGLGDPTRSSPGVGLYLDQRENRARLSLGPRGASGRLLNLFAHTGSFSVAWLAAGGDAAVSVDLSGAYLRWLDENLAENELASPHERGRHEGVRQDGRHFLEKLPPSERFDAIVLDPPTAAASGRRFWSVAKELPPLVERALAHLAPGGRLLVSRNDRRGSALDSLVAGAAEASQVRLARIEAAAPGVDFPRLDGFPEGDSFSAVIATREGAGPRARAARGAAEKRGSA